MSAGLPDHDHDSLMRSGAPDDTAGAKIGSSDAGCTTIPGARPCPPHDRAHRITASPLVNPQ
ncbi:hypothetical protein T261_6940 [Streptomyces lydicus]|nr:hypothetical protein T261_6940 [Streptomyces lydicus]